MQNLQAQSSGEAAPAAFSALARASSSFHSATSGLMDLRTHSIIAEEG